MSEVRDRRDEQAAGSFSNPSRRRLQSGRAVPVTTAGYTSSSFGHESFAGSSPLGPARLRL